MEHTELPHRHGNDRDLSRLEHCMQEAESFQAVAGLCRLLSDANRVRIFWLLCHCEECVVNLAALVGMSSPAASHHLRQLKDSGLVVSRRIGKEVYYRAADTEVAGLLHQVIERTVEVTCPREEAMPHAPHLPPVDAHAGEHAADLTPQQREIIHQVHQLLTENLDSRITIEQLSRRFLMNPSTMKELFKAEYGSSIAAHIRQHRMEKASALLLESGDSLAQVARAVGYESQSKFSAEFKKVFGMLPSEFRKLHAGREADKQADTGSDRCPHFYFSRISRRRAWAMFCTGSSSSPGRGLSSRARRAGIMHWVKPRRCTSVSRCSRWLMERISPERPTSPMAAIWSGTGLSR